MGIDSESKRIRNDKKLTTSEKIDKLTELFTSYNYQVLLRTDNQLQVIKKKSFSWIISLLCILLFFIYFPLALTLFIIYVLVYLAKNDDTRTITFKSKNLNSETNININDNKDKTERIIELSKMLEKGLITEDEFLEMKKEIIT